MLLKPVMNPKLLSDQILSLSLSSFPHHSPFSLVISSRYYIFSSFHFGGLVPPAFFNSMIPFSPLRGSITSSITTTRFLGQTWWPKTPGEHRSCRATWKRGQGQAERQRGLEFSSASFLLWSCPAISPFVSISQAGWG